MRWSLTISASALAWALAACGSENPPAGSGEIGAVAAGPQVQTGGFLVHAPAAEVAHRGERRIDIFDPSAAVPTHLAYRERIETDGTGRYSLVPITALTPVQPGWLLVQRNREGYLFRYRDFEVRDVGLFRRNYVLTDLDARVRVAGRECARYRVERVVGRPKRFDLSVDLETNLILKAEEYRAGGELLSVVEYESFGLDPDLDAAVWFEGVHQEEPLDRTRSFGEQLGAEPPMPRLLPVGFELREAFTLVDDEQTSWLKLTYTDGVETLFFLTALAGGSAGPLAPSEASPAPGRAGDEVVLFRMGAAHAAQGTIGGRRYIAVGKVADDTLLDLIESSLP